MKKDMQELQILVSLENGEITILVIQVEPLGIWLPKFSVVKITLMKLTISQLEL